MSQWQMDNKNSDIIMLKFWPLFSSFFRIRPVPRPASLRPPQPRPIHQSRLRRRLHNGPPHAPCWSRASEEAPGPPGVAVDQAGAALYGLPPALAVQRLHVGLGHHHFGAGGAHARLVRRLHRPTEESRGKRPAQASWTAFQLSPWSSSV